MDRFCIECGRRIVPTFEYRSKLYCSIRCRTRAHNKKYKPKQYRVTYSFNCAYCGALVTITPQDKKRIKYCSDSCRKIALSERRVEAAMVREANNGQ